MNCFNNFNVLLYMNALKTKINFPNFQLDVSDKKTIPFNNID